MWSEKCFTFDSYSFDPQRKWLITFRQSRACFFADEGEAIGFNWIPFVCKLRKSATKAARKGDVVAVLRTQTKKQGRSLFLTFLQELNLSLIVLFVCIQLKYYNDYCLRPITDGFSLLVSSAERLFLSVATIWVNCAFGVLLAHYNLRA